MQNSKRIYERPELSLISLPATDIMTISTGDQGPLDPLDNQGPLDPLS